MYTSNHLSTKLQNTPNPGLSGEEGWVDMELKLLADVGLVGPPNAGKSTLLSVISAARPKVAAYPFTTLTPNIGIVAYRDNYSFSVSDIPGILQGASRGKGLGIHFLKHIERNTILLFLIPSDNHNIKKMYDILCNELGAFDSKLLNKKKILVISKSDLIDSVQKRGELRKNLFSIPHIFVSAFTQFNILQLKDMIWKFLCSEQNSLH